MKQNNWIMTIVIAVLVGALAFYGGMQYQKSQRGNSGYNGTGQAGTGGMMRRFGGQGGNGNGGNRVVGQIISSDDKSITVKLQDGSTKIVLITSSTSINKAAQATKSDLQNGTTVAVFGPANSDGSVTAQSVQINPMMRSFRSGGSNPQTNSSQ